MLDTDIELLRTRRLESRAQWTKWISSLRAHALNLGIWERLDPNKPDQPEDKLKPPRWETLEHLKERMTAENAIAKREPPTNSEVIVMHSVINADVEYERSMYELDESKYHAIRNWITTTVDQSILCMAFDTVADKDPKFTLRQLITTLKNYFAIP